jgi:hypothetical protein
MTFVTSDLAWNEMVHLTFEVVAAKGMNSPLF